ncbi:UbiA-like polyprenyltransferase [Hydrogenobacter thermophilus]|uniref:UbiA-like polyprenyltransferase n=1 Tax=Hydrogenobacter thermophilus TaxID=940 RepID=UPI0030F58DF7
MTIKDKLKSYAQLVKFEHTIFALPFALASLLILYKSLPSPQKVFWVVVALVSARTAGMALNRLIDLPIDQKNPRTKNWVHASGKVKKYDMLAIILVSSMIFLVSTAFINLYTFLLSPVVLFLLWLYPYSKRFTHFPHLVLGAVYFLIPLGVDIALNERVSLPAMLLGVGMAFWVAGFDVLYSLQDYEFDKKHGIKSLAVKLGIEKALLVSKLFHVITFFSLLTVGFVSELGVVYFVGLLVLAGFLIYEHSLVKPNDLSKINKAFFTVNGYVSIIFMLVVLLDRLL